MFYPCIFCVLTVIYVFFVRSQGAGSAFSFVCVSVCMSALYKHTRLTASRTGTRMSNRYGFNAAKGDGGGGGSK